VTAYDLIKTCHELSQNYRKQVFFRYKGVTIFGFDVLEIVTEKIAPLSAGGPLHG